MSDPARGGGEVAGTGTLRCSECDDEVDWCSFCDEAGCGVAVCYGCLAVRLGEWMPQPHPHGG